ncbi:CGNR zinc finger domain-containing protein [Arthrobacter sp.]|uniref:CGNR zinc finger domain-containing protein n=1 Tax=Arthrobacter sp. TaxID=1667 RepID=UPI003A8FAF5E
MHLNPYGEYAVLLAASLANDWPADRDGIDDRMRTFGMTMAFPEAQEDHARTRGMIDDWLLVVDAAAGQERATLLNAQMEQAAAYPRLSDHDDEGWHLHYRDTGQSLPDALRAVISVGTALHLTTRGMHRLGRCQSAPCEAVIVDTTRNGRQRYCSVQCANRAAVRRHRSERSRA